MSSFENDESGTDVVLPGFGEALANASRILRAAVVETNLPLMERLEKLADSWANIAAMLTHRDC